MPASSVDADADIAALTLGSVEERWAAARRLATHPGTAAALGHALGNEANQRVREAIFTGLARLDSTESFHALLPYLRSDDANLRTGALDALRAMPSAVPPGLEALLHDGDPDVRILACDLARDVSSPDAAQMLASLLETDLAVNVCAAAVDALAEIGSPDVLPSLVRCAERFSDQPFLGFAVRVASERIRSQSSAQNG